MSSTVRWYSQERALKDLTNTRRRHRNILEEFLQEHAGLPAVIRLKDDGKRMKIIICHTINGQLIVVRRFTHLRPLIIPLREIVMVGIE